jgi:hypothetical protein
MNRSETLAKIAPALVAALGKIEGAAKKKTNPGFKSKYADLETVIDASRDILTEHKLTLIQLPGALVNGVLTLETILLHESGEFISGDMGIQLGKQDPQGVGSALTYARRYAQMAALNMPAVDDDGEAAHGRPRGALEAITPATEGPDFWKCEGQGMSAFAAKKSGMDDMHERMRHVIHEMGTPEGMREFIEANLADIQKMPKSWRIELRAECDEAARRFNSGQGGAGGNVRAA